MFEATAAAQIQAPTQETGPLPRLGDRDRRRASAAVARLDPGRYLAVEDGGEVVVFPLSRLPLRIGRSPAADIEIDDLSVSRRHAVLVERADRVEILDDRSLNGVILNGDRVREAALTNGDSIEIGKVRLRFVEIT
jgi:pSer/pThr/pTyr-binding forkhead associated (FHA) protein